MRIISSVLAATGALAGALTWGAAAPPAEAGRVCDELGLSSPCIRSNDLKARINLDEDGRDGRLRVRDADGENAVELDGSSANVTNLFSNVENESNGLVKAWAQMNADGMIDACWRCNTDPAETRRIGTGVYKVDFTPLSTDIRGRPRLATINSGSGIVELAVLRVVDDDTGDFSAAIVITNDPTSNNPLVDTSFVLFIY